MGWPQGWSSQPSPDLLGAKVILGSTSTHKHKRFPVYSYCETDRIITRDAIDHLDWIIILNQAYPSFLLFVHRFQISRCLTVTALGPNVPPVFGERTCLATLWTFPFGMSGTGFSEAVSQNSICLGTALAEFTSYTGVVESVAPSP